MGELKQDGGVYANLLQKYSKVKDSAMQEGDYIGEDGLLYCGRCRTKKQGRYDLPWGGVITPYILCECAVQAKLDEEKAKEMQELRMKIDSMKRDGIADPEYLKWTFSADDRKNQKISDATRRYVNKWDEMFEKNMGLMFYGNVGTGKSFYAACIANAIMDKGIPALMTNVSALITAISQDFEKDKAKILGRISEVPLLILDDVGVERDTAYASEKMQEIIDTRYRAGKPLVITTNLSPQELANPKEMKYKRAYDRLLEMCYPILLDGTSRRREKAFNKRQDAKDILGL